MTARWVRFASFLLIVPCRFAVALPADGTPVQFNDNGYWSWFQDERAIIDPNTNQLLIGSVASGDGVGGAARDGDNDVVSYNLNTGATSRFTLIDFTYLSDDHFSPALLTRPDGRYLAVYTAHQNDSLVRWRVSTNPGDATSWQPEQTLTPTTNRGTTYSNVYHLSSNNTIYDFYRGNNYDPHLLTSTNSGGTFSNAGHVLMDPANNSGQRPYVKYASNGVDRIYFTTTEAHPRDLNTGIYAGYMTTDGHLHRLDGTDIGTLGTTTGTAVSATAFTTVLAPNAVVNGTTRTRAWTTDLALDSSGNPYTVFTSRVNNLDTDHRFYYSRWTGSSLVTHEIAKAGGYLYTAENDYTGLAALSPSDPNTLYISTKIDPRDGSTTTSKYEIYRGFTTDTGASWTWLPITTGSSVDNLRPIVPDWDDTHTALIWFSGTYTTYQHANTAVVGKFYTGNNGWWTNPAGGDWNTSANWGERRIGTGMSFIADFSALDIAGDVTVNNPTPRTLGVMTFGDTNTASVGDWIMNGATVSLHAGVIAPIINVKSRTATLAVPLEGTEGFTKTGSGTLILSAANQLGGVATVNQGTLVLNHAQALGGTLSIANTGRAKLSAGLGSPLMLAGLVIGGVGQLDLTDNAIEVDYAGSSPLASIVSLINTGKIMSSLADATHGVGIRDDSDVVLVKYALFGDANLDGSVDINDLATLATNWQQSGIWSAGDFDRSGLIDIADLALLATNWQAGVPAPGAMPVPEVLASLGLACASVPEPAAALFLLLCPLARRYRN